MADAKPRKPGQRLTVGGKVDATAINIKKYAENITYMPR